jgi:hypothetical protein
MQIYLALTVIPFDVEANTGPFLIKELVDTGINTGASL